MMHTTNQIRQAFLNYFAKHNHHIASSSSLMPHQDPTLMFTNAGMNQFKNYFTNIETPKYKKIATAQKCVRAGGKHNDLNNVGHTARHHTFFEMLGNFAFGDYFKEEAIFYAWQFLTKELCLNPNKLLVTVYHTDLEALTWWQKIANLPAEKIIKISTDDNFWSMGEVGPCGPCSEIFFDHGEHIFGGPPGSPNQDGDRFVEIWNLVFMQFEKTANQQLLNLPKPCIDTGMGLERISAVVQGKTDNYQTNTFTAIINKLNQILN
jgi:alanyl-tRNA synthetase